MRPWAFGDVWDRMTPSQRRFAVITDWIVALTGAAVVYIIVSYIG